MAKRELREAALKLRKQGMSYSQIKNVIGVSKSTLSLWLEKFPLSPERIRELRDTNQQRIERYRETRAGNRQKRFEIHCENQRDRIGTLSEREIFIAGLFLYWAEGTKASRGVVCVTNTDPAMMRFFIEWVETQGISRYQVRIRLHLYSDMNASMETDFWSQTLGLPLESFRKPHIKESLSSRITYKGRFGHGTCNLLVYNMELYERIMAGIHVLRTRM